MTDDYDDGCHFDSVWWEHVEPDLDCPESHARALEYEVERLRTPRRLRHNSEFASALEAVQLAATVMRQEQSMCDDIPSVFVAEEDVQRAGDHMERVKELLFDLVEAISEANRVLAVALADIERRTDLHAPESPGYNRGPPGHVVTTLPHRPTGPPCPATAPFSRAQMVMLAA